MTSDEREAVEFVCGLQMIDDHLDSIESAVDAIREMRPDCEQRMAKISGLLGDIFLELGIQI